MTPVAQNMRFSRALRLGLAVALFLAVVLPVATFAATDTKKTDAKDAKKTDAKADPKAASTNAAPKELPIPVSVFKDEKKPSGEAIGVDPFYPQSHRRFPPPPTNPVVNVKPGTTNVVVKVEVKPELWKQLKAKGTLGRLGVISSPVKNYTFGLGETQMVRGEGISAKVTLKEIKSGVLVITVEGEGTKELELPKN